MSLGHRGVSFSDRRAIDGNGGMTHATRHRTRRRFLPRRYPGVSLPGPTRPGEANGGRWPGSYPAAVPMNGSYAAEGALRTAEPANDPVASAEAFAAEHRTSGRMLDFSLESLLANFDRIVELPMFNHGRDKPATAAEDRAQAALCAYVGESLRRAFAGEWVGEFDPDAPIHNYYRSRVRFGAFHLNPHSFVGYRLTNGPEEGTFQAYLKEVLPSIEARDGERDPRFP